jgi:hypothetical protein
MPEAALAVPTDATPAPSSKVAAITDLNLVMVRFLL